MKKRLQGLIIGMLTGAVITLSSFVGYAEFDKERFFNQYPELISENVNTEKLTGHYWRAGGVDFYYRFKDDGTYTEYFPSTGRKEGNTYSIDEDIITLYNDYGENQYLYTVDKASGKIDFYTEFGDIYEVLHCTSMKASTPHPEKTSFDSYVSDWAKTDIEKAYESNLIPQNLIGKDLTDFVDRAEFCAIAVGLYEKITNTTASEENSDFEDIDGNIYETYIKKAYSAGIVNGYIINEHRRFLPKEFVNREQCATMLCRTLKKYSISGWSLEADADYPMDISGVDTYADDDKISDWAKPSVYYMTKLGFINGIGNNYFSSYENWIDNCTTREQAIIMALRMSEM